MKTLEMVQESGRVSEKGLDNYSRDAYVNDVISLCCFWCEM